MSVIQEILDFPLDVDSSGLKFSQRLARENGWTEDFTQRAVVEYKRFLIISSLSDFSLTPSDVVDQVWHLHLCYTESYWTDLCKNTLGFELHHGPTKGGEAEQSKYRDWYTKTLDCYKTVFEEAAPMDIWPSVEMRFSDQQFRRIDLNDHFVVSKSTIKQVLMGGTAAILFLAVCFIVVNTFFSAGFSIFVTSFMAFVVLLCVFKNVGKAQNGLSYGILGGGFGTGGIDSGGSDGGCSSGCGGCGGCGG